MSGWIKNLLLYLMLFCMMATIIPFANLHNHDTTPCDISDMALGHNPCHIKMYHPQVTLGLQCEHKSHILDAHQHCTICKFIIEKKIKSHIKTNSLEHDVFFQLLEKDIINYKNVIFFESPQKFSLERGPPA